MTREQFNERDFGEVLDEMINEGVITTYDSLKEFAVEKIKEDDLITALHIIESVIEDREVYYIYDYSMGTLETPRSVRNKEDLEEFIES